MKEPRRTKIISTYGPSVASREKMEAIILAGTDVVRFNFSHGSHEYHRQGMEYVKAIREERELPVGILLDTKGPKIRTGEEQEEEVIGLKNEERVELTTIKCKNTASRIYVDYPELPRYLAVGSTVLIDDGRCRLEVIGKNESGLSCIIRRGGHIKAKRGINIPGVSLPMPFLSDKDKRDLDFAAEMEVDIIAASFVRTAEDIRQIRHYLFKNHEFTCDIVAKIENQQGVDNIKEIGQVSDAIMIARGDLGVELPVENVPRIQKQIIKLCRKLGKPVITATQMLESMIEHERPTRAEVSDVANAVYDSTSAIMLSGETASGNFPVACVEMMDTIARQAESDNLPDSASLEVSNERSNETTKAMAGAAITTAKALGADAIITLTSSGYSSRMVSRLRPRMAIISATQNLRTYYKMSLYWGVHPVLSHYKSSNLGDLFSHTMKLIEERHLLPVGSFAVMLGGSPVGISGSTNVLRIGFVGNVALRGKPVVKVEAQGQVHLFKTRAAAPEGRVLVMRYLLEEDLGILPKCKALILQGAQGERMARIVGETLKIPVITRAEGCTSVLNENEQVRVDGSAGIVYRVTD